MKTNTVGSRKSFFAQKEVNLKSFGILTLSLLASFLSVHMAYAELKFEQTVIEEVVSFDATSHPFSFKFTNESEGDVCVSGVKASCDCVELEETMVFYSAGEQGSVRGVVDLTRINGELATQIFIDIQGCQNRQSTMNLKLRESKYYSFSPQFIEWNHKDEIAPRYIRLEAIGSGATLGVVESTEGQFDVQVAEGSWGSEAMTLKVTPISTQARFSALFQIVATVSGEPIETYNFRFAIL